MNANIKAFLYMIAWSELGTEILQQSDDGYNVIVGSRPGKLILFDSYADHPRKKVWIESIHNYSTAAGRYQQLKRNYDVYKKQLGLKDFGKNSQDIIAIQQIKECNSLELIINGNISKATHNCARIWASLPGPGCDGQRENQLGHLLSAYKTSGGTLVA